MSVESVALVLNHSRAKGTAKLVLIGIANHDGDGGAWPTIETLAKYANVDERNVQRCIRRLVDDGELAVENNRGGNANWRNDKRPNRYKILVKPDGVANTSPGYDGVANTPHGVASVPDGVTLVAERGDVSVLNGVALAPPKPSNNHPITIHHHQPPHGETSGSDPGPGAGVGGGEDLFHGLDESQATDFVRWLRETQRVNNPVGLMRSLSPLARLGRIGEWLLTVPPAQKRADSPWTEAERIALLDHRGGLHTVGSDPDRPWRGPDPNCPTCKDINPDKEARGP